MKLTSSFVVPLSFSCVFCCSAWCIGILCAWSTAIIFSQVPVYLKWMTIFLSPLIKTWKDSPWHNRVQISLLSRNDPWSLLLPPALSYISNTGISLHHYCQHPSFSQPPLLPGSQDSWLLINRNPRTQFYAFPLYL